MVFPTCGFSDGACCSDWTVSSLDMFDRVLLKLFVHELSE